MVAVVLCMDAGSVPTVQPLLRSIRRNMPAATIFLLTDVLVEDPLIDRVAVLPVSAIPRQLGPFARITVHTYYRFFIDVLFPELERCIYLDYDTLVLSDISDLLEGDTWCIKGFSLNDTGYINAGVIAFNFTQECRRLLSVCRGRITESDDQTILNEVFQGHIAYVGPEYNCLVCGIPMDGVEPKVLHYIGSSKPWRVDRRICRWFDYMDD